MNNPEQKSQKFIKTVFSRLFELLLYFVINGIEKRD